MTRYAIRSLASHKLRTALTAIAIILGTAMMAARSRAGLNVLQALQYE